MASRALINGWPLAPGNIVAPSAVDGPLIARNNLISAMGDSRITEFMDPATKRQKGGTGMVALACSTALQRYMLVDASGMSGKRIDEYSAALPGLLAQMPGAVFMGSALNGIGQDYPTQASSGSTAASKQIENCQAVVAAGAIAVVFSEIGQVGMATVRRDQCDVYNNTMQAYAGANRGVIFIDLRPAVCGTDRIVRAELTYDASLPQPQPGTHFNQDGAEIAAGVVKAVFDTIMPNAPTWVLGADGKPAIANQNQLLTNPLFATKTGGTTQTGATGTFAGSCRFNKTGTSATLAVSNVASGVRLDCTFGAQGDNCRMSQEPPMANWSSGMKVRGMALISVDAGSVNLAGVQMTTVAQGDSVSTSYADLIATATWAGSNRASRRLLLTQEFVVPTYTTKQSLAVTVQANAFGAGSAGIVVEQIGLLQNAA